jgi:hypothetical protein
MAGEERAAVVVLPAVRHQVSRRSLDRPFPSPEQEIPTMTDPTTRPNAITINGTRFDPATAKHIAGHPVGDGYFEPDDCRRFEEHLYKTPEGYWFILRLLAPDEARAWMVAHDDEVSLRRTFPDEGGARE